MALLTFPSLGMLLRTEASRAFFVAVILLLLALAWTYRNHKLRSEQLEQEEWEDSYAIAIAISVFLLVTCSVFMAFNPPLDETDELLLGESVNQIQPANLYGQHVITIQPRSTDGPLLLLVKKVIANIGRSIRIFVGLLSSVLSSDATKSEEAMATSTLTVAISLVVACIVVLLILICFPHLCQRCGTPEKPKEVLSSEKTMPTILIPGTSSRSYLKEVDDSDST